MQQQREDRLVAQRAMFRHRRKQRLFFRIAQVAWGTFDLRDQLDDARRIAVEHARLGGPGTLAFEADERRLVVREGYLFEGYHTQHPKEDQVLAIVWHGFERFLRARLPAADRIATPAREDRYRREEWQAFLQAQGCQHFTERAMMKVLQAHAR